MSFHFSLETVLRLRQSLEDRERLRLQGLLATRARVQEEVRLTVEAHHALSGTLQTALHEEVPGGEVQFSAQRGQACEVQAKRLAASMLALKAQIERQQKMLLQRRVERRVLEHLRDRQLADYELEGQRRSQARVEELFLLRRRIGR